MLDGGKPLLKKYEQNNLLYYYFNNFILNIFLWGNFSFNDTNNQELCSVIYKKIINLQCEYETRLNWTVKAKKKSNWVGQYVTGYRDKSIEDVKAFLSERKMRKI
jgi:hypothetical protein